MASFSVARPKLSAQVKCKKAVLSQGEPRDAAVNTDRTPIHRDFWGVSVGPDRRRWGQPEPKP